MKERRLESKETKSEPSSDSQCSVPKKQYCCPCTTKQLLFLNLPFILVGLYLAIFLPIYKSSQTKGYKVIYNEDENKNSTINNDIMEEYDKFNEYLANYSFAKLTPIKGYKYIYIHLGDINEPANIYLDFFKSEKTIIPKNTKIIILTGKKRISKYMETFNIFEPVPCWFNSDYTNNLICNHCDNEFDEAKESLYLILDIIDQIKNEENLDYNKIFIGGFGQGGAMVNYVLLNSRHQLGGYCSFSGYFLDHNFPYDNVVDNLNDIQKEILQSKKNYNVLESLSFKDDVNIYSKTYKYYYNYFKEYTNIQFLSYKNYGFITMPILTEVKTWLKEKMQN